PGRAQHPDLGLVVEQLQEPAVEIVQGGVHGHIVHREALDAAQNVQADQRVVSGLPTTPICVSLRPMTDTTMHLTAQEREAQLELDQLKQLVGLVPYDETKDVFPVTGGEAIVFVVGNATQAAHYYQSACGMELVGYSGPETGNRDHKAFVLRSGSIKFVIKGGVDPDSPLHDHVRRHGDGVVDI